MIMLIAYNHSTLTIKDTASIFMDNLLNKKKELYCEYCDNIMRVSKTIFLMENRTICCSQDCAYKFKDRLYQEKNYEINHIIFFIKPDPSLEDLLKLKNLAIQTGKDCRFELARLGEIDTRLITMKIVS